MGDCKRCAPSTAAMEVSSSEANVSKKRKTTSSEFPLRSSDAQRLPNSRHSVPNFPDTTVSPEASVNSAGTVVSGEFSSDRSSLSCCSSNYVVETGEVVKEPDTMPLDLEVRFSKFCVCDTVVFAFLSFFFFFSCML